MDSDCRISEGHVLVTNFHSLNKTFVGPSIRKLAESNKEKGWRPRTKYRIEQENRKIEDSRNILVYDKRQEEDKFLNTKLSQLRYRASQLGLRKPEKVLDKDPILRLMQFSQKKHNLIGELLLMSDENLQRTFSDEVIRLEKVLDLEHGKNLESDHESYIMARSLLVALGHLELEDDIQKEHMDPFFCG